MITTQVYNKIASGIRKAATDLVLFCTTNKKELDSVYQDFINIPKPDFDKVCRYCFKTKHDFLVYRTAMNEYYHNFNKLELDFNI